MPIFADVIECGLYCVIGLAGMFAAFAVLGCVAIWRKPKHPCPECGQEGEPSVIGGVDVCRCHECGNVW